LALIDTNVLLDLVTDDSEWFEWSLKAIETAAADNQLYVNAAIYAELSVRFEATSAVDALLGTVGAEFVDIPRRAAFLAAKVFVTYKAAGGAKTGVLPDFFIGAHAAVLKIPLLTRDVRRYRTYFPEIDLISPYVN